MDFSLEPEEYTKEQEELAREVRAWLGENVPKGLVRVTDPNKMSREQYDMRREFARKLGEKGWLYPTIPTQYGGGGLTGAHATVIADELARRGVHLPLYYDIGPSLAAPAIYACGTEDQKRRFLPPIYRAEVVSWQLFTEPEAGTDEANQQTNALRHVHDNEYFIINGSKIFVGGIYPPPGQLLLLTRSDLKAPRHENLAMFIIPADLPGINIQPLDLFTSANFGQACSHAADASPGQKFSVFFDEVRVHESYLLGGERDGWKATNATLMVEHAGGERGERGSISVARSLLLDKFLDQCKNNPNVARRLKENPQLAESVVEVYIGTQIERLFAIRNAGLPRTGRRVPYAGPQLSLYTKILGNKLSAHIARVLGPYASIDDDKWGLDDGFFEVGQRGAVSTAPAGTPEALKIIISRSLGIGR